MANPEHLAILKQGVEAWNKWREENPEVKPELSSADLTGFKLERVNLQGAKLRNTNLQGVNLYEANLQGADLLIAELQGAILSGANLQGANLRNANFQEADLTAAHLEHANIGNAHLERANLGGANLLGAHLMEANLTGVNFDMAHLQGAFLQRANLQGAVISLAHLEGADLIRANLKNARVVGANLQGAILSGTNLEGANFQYAIVDGKTLINDVEVDCDTNFEGVGLDAMRIDPGIKQLLEYNIRRKNWGKWYKEHKFLRYIVKPFWQISDYGLSTKRIIAKFFMWAAVFALVYLFFDYAMQDGIVNNLSQVDGQQVPWWLVPIRAFYFSVVTMTTLGFGDMYARFNSFWGHFLLTIQVLMGYMFLGALVTRFAVLFTAGGPAAKFTELTEES